MFLYIFAIVLGIIFIVATFEITVHVCFKDCDIYYFLKVIEDVRMLALLIIGLCLALTGFVCWGFIFGAFAALIVALLCQLELDVIH